ncbi:hypothetical protein V6Z11_D10G144200 [Gossypium hirsutum]
MLRMKDKADNTAFHMAVECPPDDIDVVRLLVKELELDPEFSLSANKSEIGNNAGEEGIRHHKSFRENMGNDNNPSTLKEVVDKLRETHLLVAALVATIAFTAANAVPGGYKADDKGTVDEGTAILSHNSAFKTLVMTNAMAVVSSLLAIFLHFLSVFIHLKAAESLVLKCILVTDGLTVFTMAAMVVSSSAGSYAVL